MPTVERWKVRNTSEQRLVFPTITSGKGHTLVLDPGEEDVVFSEPPVVEHLEFKLLKPTDLDSKPQSKQPDDESGDNSGG